MVSVTPAQSITANDFLDMEHEGLELVNGRVEEMPLGARSSWVGGQVFHRLQAFLDEAPVAFAFPQETGIAIWDRQKVRKPDAMVIKTERLPDGPPDGWLTVVPDLVVEVVSPRDLVEKLDAKLDDYRRAGVPLIWVIHPDTRKAYVFERGKPIIEITAEDILEAPTLLPGFRLPLNELLSTRTRANES